MHAWFVARTKHRKEACAERALERRGLTVFLPRIVELRYDQPASVSRRLVPLFPGYLFVRMCFPADYGPVTWAPGVRELVSFGGGPVPVDDGVIDDLVRRCDVAGVVDAAPARWRPGDRVEISVGPFAGQLATVLGVTPSRRRVKLLIAFLARQAPLEVPLAVLPPSGRGAVRAAFRSARGEPRACDVAA
jgi:transcriptional antiterminator RfaH